MAEKFKPQTFDINSINGGNKFNLSDGISANAVNAPIEAAGYAQALATNQPNNSEAGLIGEPTVSIEQAENGTPRFKFSQLRGKDHTAEIAELKNIQEDHTAEIDELKSETNNIKNILQQAYGIKTTQAYISRVTAKGENIFDEQLTPVLEIAGDTVNSTNLFDYNTTTFADDYGTQFTGSSGTLTITNTHYYVSKGFVVGRDIPRATQYTFSINVLSYSDDSGAIPSIRIVPRYISVDGVISYGSEAKAEITKTGIVYCTLNVDTTKTLYSLILRPFSKVNNTSTCTISMNKMMLNIGGYVEYVPYFAGLKNAFINSIKSTGRNLFNVNTDFIKAIEEKWYTTYPVKVENGIFYSSGKRGISVGSCICCELVENKDYVLSFIANFDEATEYPATVELNFFNDWTGNKFNSLKNIRKVVVNGGNTITFNSGDCRYVAVGAFSVTLYGTALSNIQIEYGKVATEFEPYKEEIYQLPQALELGKWDKFNPQTGLIRQATAYETSETPFTEEQIAGYKNAVVSADGLSLAYETDIPIIRPIDAPKNYLAWKNGSETIIQGDTDNSGYGAMPTITQTYLVNGDE